jgi:hypothetical protein
MFAAAITNFILPTMKKYFVLSMILGMAIGYVSRHSMEVSANDRVGMVVLDGKDKKKDKKAKKENDEKKEGEKKSCAPGGSGGQGCCHGKKAS